MFIYSNKCDVMSRTQQFTFYENIVIKTSKLNQLANKHGKIFTVGDTPIKANKTC